MRTPLIAFLLAAVLAPLAPAATAPLTARQVVERLQQHSGVTWSRDTVDTFKAGDPATPVKGVAVCMMSTLEVLQRAAAAGANLVITHEPTFWGHVDALEPMASENDAVLAAKRQFIADHGLVIFRFHDHIHQMKPDMIVHGVAADLGWTEHATSQPGKYALPATTLGELARAVKAKLGIRTLRVIGDPALPVKTIGFSPGFSGFGANRRLLQDPTVDVLVLGEAHEWETIEYGADAIAAGKQQALIVLGHIPSEEGGMRECADWLKGFVTEVPVTFIKTPEPFWSP